MLLVCRFVVSGAQTETFTARAREALRLLTEQPGCRNGHVARSVDDPTRWVLVVEFDSIVAYRKALSPFPVREQVIPLLAEALTDEPAGYELAMSAGSGKVEHQVSLLAADADSVRLGEAAGPTLPRS